MIKKLSVRYELFLLELLASVIARVSINGIKHISNLETRVYFCALPHYSPSWKAVWAGTWRQDRMQSLWRNAPSWFALQHLLSLSYGSQNHQSRDGAIHSELTGPSHINQENIPESCPQATLWWVNFLN